MFTYLFQSNFWLIAAAVVPAIILMYLIYKADRLDKEPKKLLLRLVLCGCAAAVLSMITESVGNAVLGAVLPAESTLYYVLMFFVVVAGSEEGFKYLLMKRATWNNPEFNCQFDAVVYATYTALGFALFENVGYVFMYGFGTALLRAVTAIPGHCCFGVFMGTWYGMAKRYEHTGELNRSTLCRKLALIVPMILHGIYDFIAVTAGDYGVVIFGVFIIGLFVFAIRKTRSLARNDQYI